MSNPRFYLWYSADGNAIGDKDIDYEEWRETFAYDGWLSQVLDIMRDAVTFGLKRIDISFYNCDQLIPVMEAVVRREFKPEEIELHSKKGVHTICDNGVATPRILENNEYPGLIVARSLARARFEMEEQS